MGKVQIHTRAILIDAQRLDILVAQLRQSTASMARTVETRLREGVRTVAVLEPDGRVPESVKAKDLERFAGYDAMVVGISVDSIPSHTAWQKKEIGVLGFPLASDFYPHGEVAKKFGILREGDPIPGINERAIFIVDKQGKLAFSRIYPIGQVPSNDDIFEVLRKL